MRYLAALRGYMLSILEHFILLQAHVYTVYTAATRSPHSCRLPLYMPKCGVDQAVIGRTYITIDELRHVPLDPILAGSTSANALISEMKTRLDGCTHQSNTLSSSTQRAPMMAVAKGEPGLTE